MNESEARQTLWGKHSSRLLGALNTRQFTLLQMLFSASEIKQSLGIKHENTPIPS